MAEREHKYPVGTIRTWESGPVIKAHDNSIFNSGWIPMPDIPSWLNELLIGMDLTGNSIIRAKTPIDGELWLQKIIEEWKSPSGWTYSLADFKKYKGIFGASAYSFRNVFSKRFFNDKILLREEIDNALLQANQNKFNELHEKDPKTYFQYDDRFIYLSKEEINDIKKHVKKIHVPIEPLDQRDVDSLNELLNKVNGYLKKGFDFDPEEKIVYEKNNLVRINFTDTYKPLKEKRQEMNEAISEINIAFGDNWGIRESFRKHFSDKFDEYIDKYLDRIKKDELANFQKELGCDIDAPLDTFYNCLSKVGNKYSVNLRDYIGKYVPDPYNKYKDVLLISIDPLQYKKDNGQIEQTYQQNIARIEKSLVSREVGDMQLPLQIRFSSLYNKKITGKWDFDEAVALKSMEKIFNYLPPGHCLTNNGLKVFDKDDMIGSDGYACYKPSQATIWLSSKALQEASRMTSLHSGDEFASVMMHEIGHAVEKKVGLRNSLAYKKFGFYAGWNWDLYRGRSVFSTGNMPDIARNSVHNVDSLITKYAQKSPSEAFAEYYSFYNQYKSHIDDFLDHNKTDGLYQHNEIKISELNSKYKGLTFGNFINSSKDISKLAEITDVLLENKRDLDEHFFVDVVDPWDIAKNEQLKYAKLDPRYVRNFMKDLRHQDQTAPVFSIKDFHGKHIMTDDIEMHINEANKYLKNYTPTYSCTEEAYNLLKMNNFTDTQIQAFTLMHVQNKMIPRIDKSSNVKKVVGLRYRNSIVPAEKLIKNKEIFKAMRDIYYSDALKKAMEELFNSPDNTDQLINKSYSEEPIVLDNTPMTKKSLYQLFKKHIVNPIANSLGGFIKASDIEENLTGEIEPIVQLKKYADSIILDTNGKILLLQRSSDSIFPNEWCLPGGHVDVGEEFYYAAIRELKEETSLTSDLQLVCHSEKPDCIIQYFFGRTDLNPTIILDPKEHQNYAWANITELNQFKLILDLSDKLSEIFDITADTTLLAQVSSDEFYDIQELTFEKAFEAIKKSYDDGLISDDVYFSALQKYEKIKQFNLPLDEQFSKGLITEEIMFDRIQKGKVKAAEEAPKDLEEEDPTEDVESNDDPENVSPDDDQESAQQEDSTQMQDPSGNQEPDSSDPDQVHGKTGMNYDKLRQLAMTTPQQQLENFIKHSKDPELRKIAHDELARRLDDEHPQEDDSESDTKSSTDKKDKKPTNAKEAMDAGKSDKDNVQDDPDYSEKALQYAKAVTSGQDPSQNPFLADFATHMEEKIKNHKPLDITVEIPGESNNESDEDKPNTEGENIKIEKSPSKPKMKEKK